MAEIYGVNSAVNLWRANAGRLGRSAKSNPRKLMHELLHTLGLDHPGPYNGDSADYESQALFYQDSHQYTVMSYWLADVTGADHEANGVSYFASTPLLYDVASLQYLYGANMTTRTGNTVYGFNSTAGREVFDLSLHPQSVFTIWDAGGRDTLDLSGFASPPLIDLHRGRVQRRRRDDRQYLDRLRRPDRECGGRLGQRRDHRQSSRKTGLSGGAGGDIFTFTERDAPGRLDALRRQEDPARHDRRLRLGHRTGSTCRRSTPCAEPERTTPSPGSAPPPSRTRPVSSAR